MVYLISSFLQAESRHVIQCRWLDDNSKWCSPRFCPWSSIFLIYINDQIVFIDISIKVYVDDTKLIFTYNDSLECVELQNSIDIVNIWTKKFLLFLNVEKCKILHVGLKNIKIIKQFIIFMVLLFNLLSRKKIWEFL